MSALIIGLIAYAFVVWRVRIADARHDEARARDWREEQRKYGPGGRDAGEPLCVEDYLAEQEALRHPEQFDLY
jgi:hypothetical protein